MMGHVRIDDLHVSYPGRPADALSVILLDVQPGAWLGVTGRTGAGKSTLALAIAGFLPRVIPSAGVAGAVCIDEVDALMAGAGDLLGRVGIVFSTPTDQLSGSRPTVREELAFGLENLAVPRADMDARIDAVMTQLGIGHLAERHPSTLSGGEQQRVAIASIVVMTPSVLILDEPTAELDPVGTEAVAALLVTMHASGTTIVCTSHDGTLLDRAGRVLRLDAGWIVDGPAPTPAIEALAWASAEARRGPSVVIETVSFAYPGGAEAVRDVSLEIPSGESVALVGPNGSGKTTLAKHLIGLLRPDAGRILLDDADISDVPVQTLAQNVGFAFQDPGDQLFERTVEREVGFGPRQLGRSAAETAALVHAALAMTGLTAERLTNPYDLDRSIRKLVTLAGVLAMDPGLLVLDEPTTGQDPEGVERVGRVVEAMQHAGRTILAVTHDTAFAERWFDRIVVMESGRVVEDRRRPGA